MIHLASIRHFKKTIAITFAISILAVIACDVICSLDRTSPFARQNALLLASVKTERIKKDHHAHDHHHQSDPGTTPDHSHDSSSDNQDNCCEDITNQFYQSLFKTNDATILKTPALSLILITELTNYKYLSTTKEYSNPEPTPPKIPPKIPGNYLRILMSSFLI